MDNVDLNQAIQVLSVSANEAVSALAVLSGGRISITIGAKLIRQFASGITVGQGHMNMAYAKWYNVGHPYKKVNWRRLNRQQRDEAWELWMTGILNAAYLPRKIQRLYEGENPQKWLVYKNRYIPLRHY